MRVATSEIVEHQGLVVHGNRARVAHHERGGTERSADESEAAGVVGDGGFDVRRAAAAVPSDRAVAGKFTADARVHSLDELLVNELPPARLIVPPLMPAVLTVSDERLFWPESVSVLALFCTRTPWSVVEMLIGASVVGPALLTTSVPLLTMSLVCVNCPSRPAAPMPSASVTPLPMVVVPE